MRHNFFKRAAAIVTAVVLTGAFTACSSTSDNTADDSTQSETSDNSNNEDLQVVRIGYSGNNGAAAGLLGYIETTGLLEEELNKIGYTVEYTGFETGGAGVNEALAAGQLDYAGTVDFPAIVGRASGIDSSVVAITDSLTEIDIIAKKENVKDINDLKGKKIGVQLGTVQQRFVVTVLNSVGLDVSDVEILNMTSAEAISALQTGDIDAFASVETYTAQITQTDDTFYSVATTRTNPEWGSPYVITGANNYLKDHEDVTEVIIQTLLKGKEEIISDPEHFYQTLADAFGFDYELEEYLDNKDDNKFDYCTIEITDDAANTIKADYEFALSSGLIENEFDIDSWINTSYYENAVK